MQVTLKDIKGTPAKFLALALEPGEIDLSLRELGEAVGLHRGSVEGGLRELQASGLLEVRSGGQGRRRQMVFKGLGKASARGVGEAAAFTPATRVVYLYLKNGGEEPVAETLGLGETTVKKALRELSEAGLIEACVRTRRVTLSLPRYLAEWLESLDEEERARVLTEELGGEGKAPNREEGAGGAEIARAVARWDEDLSAITLRLGMTTSNLYRIAGHYKNRALREALEARREMRRRGPLKLTVSEAVAEEVKATEKGALEACLNAAYREAVGARGVLTETVEQGQ